MNGRVVVEDGFTFAAPSGWTVAHTPRRVSARQGEQIVQVTTFPLARPYRPDLFQHVQPEIDRVATSLKEQLRATLTKRTPMVAGERASQYDLVHGNVVEQVTFVLRGKREYQLYCRRAKDESSAPCERLVSSFTLR